MLSLQFGSSFAVLIFVCLSSLVASAGDLANNEHAEMWFVRRQRDTGPLATQVRARRSTNFEYAVVIDAGSSGSRVRVYRWPDRVDGTRVETSGIEVMQPQLKLEPGLSRQVDDLSKVREYIHKLVVNASRHVAAGHHKITPIYFMATAGMRQLNEEKMNNAVRFIDTLMRNSSFNPFMYKSSINSRILSGEEEGVFAWITVNYLLGAFSDHGAPAHTAGILEMGGASTQIAFNPTGNVLADKFPVNIGRRRYPLYVHSYLDYGQDNLVRWIKQHIYNDTIKKYAPAHPDQFYDPCMFAGDVQTSQGINGTFTGTGDPDTCLRLLEILVYKVESWKCNPRPCAIGSFYQPTLPANMTFYAVGAFIYSLTSVKAIDSNGVYVPSYGFRKASEYCKQTFSEIQAASVGRKVEHYRHDCLRSLYTYVLLTRGYGFANDTDKIIVSETINEQPLDWALGAVLYENVLQECRPHDPMIVGNSASSHLTTWIVISMLALLSTTLSADSTRPHHTT